MKVIVIGINHAGTSALRTLLTQNKDLEIIAYDRNDNISFLGCGIALSVCSVVKNVNDLFYSNVDELSAMGAKVFMNTDIVKIDEVSKKVTVLDLKTNESHEESYDKLIYAGGSWPIEPKIENDHLENIQICKLYQHAQKIIEKANDKSIKNVAVIGAGYIGIELAEAFQIKGKNVYLIDQMDRVVPNYFDQPFSNKLEESLVKHGVNLKLNTTVKGFTTKDNKFVSGINTNNGEIEVDYVIKCIGFKPNGELLSNAEKVQNGAIKVNKFMQTSLKDIYAIGDCCAIYNAASEQYENIALATNAVKGGLVAACHINGLEIATLESVVGTNAIHIFGCNLSSTGLSEARAKKLNLDYGVVEWSDNDRPEWMNTYSEVSIRMIYDNKTFRLLGAQIYSNAEKETHMEVIFFLALAIQKRMSILDVATSDVYFLPHYNKPFNFVIGAIAKALGLVYVKSGSK